jgi:serine/threonine-protein kinase HipA
MAFSILINNVDDHLHNHGFLHVEKALWRLSPAFDLNPFPDRARELKTWISEETGPESSVEGLLSVARYFGLTAVRAKAILSDVQTAVGKWRKVGAQLGMTKVQLEQFEEAFADPEA